jgi:6-bladed beta-propeller protein
MSPIRRGSTIPLLLLAACGGAQASKLARARIDTLPNGAVRVMSDGPTAWSDSAGATLVEAGRFQGEDGTPSELGEPRSIAVDGQGRIYVVDEKPAAIRVFMPDGKLVRTIGREGEGPGEFRVGFIAVRNDHLVLHDPRVTRTTVYDTAGNFIRSWHSSCCYWDDIEIDEQNRIYVPSMVPRKPDERSRGTPYVRWTLEGVALDTLWVPQREGGKYWTVAVKQGGKLVQSMSTGIPFMPGTVHSLHPQGGFVYGWTGSYQIVRSSTGSDSARVFGRAWTPEPVTTERRKAEVESRIKNAAETYGEANVRGAFHLEDVPPTLPAYLNLRVDPSGRTWVRRWAGADTSKTDFDVFDSTGAYLGPVTVPLKLPEWGRQAWTKDGLVTIIEDDEGRPTVLRLKLGVPVH